MAALPSLMVSATARDAPNHAEARFGPDTGRLAGRALEEPLDRDIRVLEPDALGPATDHARDAAPLPPTHGDGTIGHARTAAAGTRRLAASCASSLRSTRMMPRRDAPSTIC